MKNLLNNPFLEGIHRKNIRIWHKLDKGAVIIGRFLYPFLEKISLGILGPRAIPITVRGYIELNRKSVCHFDRMNGYTLLIHANPNGYATCCQNNFLQRNASSEVSDSGIFITHFDRETFAVPKLKLIHGPYNSPFRRV